MINGKVPDDVLAGETYTLDELLEAASKGGWTWVHNSSFTEGKNPEFAVRHLAEWIVQNKREHFEPGEVYVDAMDRKLLRRDDDLFPWVLILPCRADEITWSQGITRPDVVGEAWPARPLRKLVPVDQAESLCTLPHYHEGE